MGVNRFKIKEIKEENKAEIKYCPWALDQVTSEFSVYGMKPYIKGQPTLSTTAHPFVVKVQLTSGQLLTLPW
ncbi:hypothetical protein F511_22753 [Dorcoceras hygrometricum]|uniref:Uncharacterized protein n=1 Tax=Dorcoceras hygrometricum TaxID=472368 RepID=A0A2Z7DDB0_9LAMI|nr:hypothetical protein F511_22753 [Dorcoceras hygrometricum]